MVVVYPSPNSVLAPRVPREVEETTSNNEGIETQKMSKIKMKLEMFRFTTRDERDKGKQEIAFSFYLLTTVAALKCWMRS